MVSSIILGYAWQILGREVFLPPFPLPCPWAVPKKLILNRVKASRSLKPSYCIRKCFSCFHVSSSIEKDSLDDFDDFNWNNLRIIWRCFTVTNFYGMKTYRVSDIEINCKIVILSNSIILQNSNNFQNDLLEKEIEANYG